MLKSLIERPIVTGLVVVDGIAAGKTERRTPLHSVDRRLHFLDLARQGALEPVSTVKEGNLRFHTLDSHDSTAGGAHHHQLDQTDHAAASWGQRLPPGAFDETCQSS